MAGLFHFGKCERDELIEAERPFTSSPDRAGDQSALIPRCLLVHDIFPGIDSLTFSHLRLWRRRLYTALAEGRQWDAHPVDKLPRVTREEAVYIHPNVSY